MRALTTGFLFFGYLFIAMTVGAFLWRAGLGGGSGFAAAVGALALLGAIHLVVVASLPGERTPGWLTNAVIYPATLMAARTIQVVLPGIGRGMDAVTPVVDSSVRRGFSDDEALPPPQTDNTSPDTATP